MSAPEQTRDKREREMLVIMTKLQTNMLTLTNDISEIKTTLRGNYVTKSEFTPVRNLVYSAVGLILISVFAALIALVVIP